MPNFGHESEGHEYGTYIVDVMDVLHGMNGHIESIEGRLDGIDGRLGEFSTRLGNVET